MAIIKAPYNFVPLSDKVYFPEWAKDMSISHDIPFEDGQSGIIELEIEAKTSIFVRNGHTKSEAEQKNDNFKSFSKLGDRYFIPGTSLKGTIRSAFEILSFSKMTLNKNARFTLRDLNDRKNYTLTQKADQIRCGWLREDELGDYFIHDCGIPQRKSHSDIDGELGIQFFTSNFKDGPKSLNLNKTGQDGIDPKTAKYKYEKTKEALRQNIADSRPLYINMEEGTLVFTGQPNKWTDGSNKRNSGKKKEFIFPDQDLGAYKLEEDRFNQYEFIYSESEDWKYLSKGIKEQGIPVFFRLKSEGGRKTIQDLGLAFMYKLPYDNRPYDLLSKEHQMENDLDLSEAVFGKTSKDFSLRGRVQFSNAFATTAEEGDEIKLILGGPKASYYPTYIEQDSRSKTVDKYATYGDGSSKLAGWKKYAPREKSYEICTDNDKLDSVLRPLKAGAKFRAKVIFHNLKKIELGALLSAISFHDSESCFHQIGQGKPYGLGRVAITSKLTIDGNEKDSEYCRDLMGRFEYAIEQKLGEWSTSSTIKEFFALSKNLIPEGYKDQFTYMEMKTSGANDFVEAKKQKEYLQRYSLLTSGAVVRSLAKDTKDRIEAERIALEEQKLAIERAEKERIEAEVRAKEEEAKEAKKTDFLENGLAIVLDEKFIEGPSLGTYKVKDLKTALGKTQRWIRDSETQITEERDKDTLAETFTRLRDNEKNEKLKAEWANFESKSPWQNIRKTLGDELAQTVFNRMK